MCNTCNGDGFIVTCIDDMCRGAGECFHGDGESVCPECGGDDCGPDDYYGDDDE
jgi:hypothetical protein